MDTKDVFDHYLTNQYSNSEGVDFSNKDQLKVLFEKNSRDIKKNLTNFLVTNFDKEKKILDLGCGYGNFLYFTHFLGYKNVTGVDISTEEIAICRDNFSEYNLIQDDIFEYLEKTQDTFDVIYLSHVLEHVPKERLDSLLQNFKKILNDGGVIIIVIPNCASYFNAGVSRYADITHEFGFVDKSLRQLFIVNGYKNENITIDNYLSDIGIIATLARKISLFLFELFIQLMGFEKQKVYTSSLIAIIRK